MKMEAWVADIFLQLECSMGCIVMVPEWLCTCLAHLMFNDCNFLVCLYLQILEIEKTGPITLLIQVGVLVCI